MKKYKLNCLFEVRSSHNISSVRFSSSSKFSIANEISYDCPFGLKNTFVEIQRHDDSLYKLNIESYDLINEASQIKYLNDLSSFLSFLIGKKVMYGMYGQHGTPYIYLKLESFTCIEEVVQNHTLSNNDIVINDSFHVSESFSLQSSQKFKFDDTNLTGALNHEMVNVYHNGLKAESERSKFFHWFLILEFLEDSPLYSQMFPKGSMFSEEESEKIRELANTFPDKKKSILLNILTRTSEYRNEKLSNLLARIDVKSIDSVQGSQQVSIDTIKEIIEARNKLFHRGSEFPTNVLWHKLFPIVTSIVEKLIYEANCIEPQKNPT